MINCSNISLVVVLVMTATSGSSAQPQSQFWRYSSPKIEIQQTGQSASQNAPPCGSASDPLKAGEVVAKAGAAAIDKYLETQGVPTVGGYGITQGLLNAVDNAGNRDWLRGRLGLNNGPSSCATQCVVYPTSQAAQLSIFGCLSETGGDGLDCGANGWDQGQWMGVHNLTHASTGKNTVSCMTGKNWSHNRNRWFWVVATDKNPLSGAPLPQVYR